MKTRNYNLVGVNGNAYAVLGYVTKAMKECGKSKDEQKAYMDAAMSGDYNNLLMESINVIEQLNEE